MAYEQEQEWAKRLGDNWLYYGRNIDGHFIYAHRYEYQWWVVDPKTGHKRFCINESQIGGH